MSFITQRGATGPLAIQAGGSFPTSTNADLSTLVGTRWDLSDGREVILVSAASTGNATAGLLFQDPALIANHQNGTVGSFTAYSNNGNTPASIVVAGNSTAYTANQYAGGFLIVNSGTGIGQTLRIASNTAGTGPTITLEDAPNVTIAANDRFCAIPPHGANVIVNPTTPTNIPVGVAFYTIPASSYGFLTSKGIVGAKSDASVPTIGEAIAASVTTAGDITLATATGGTLTSTVIGNSVQTAVSAETRAVFVNL